MTDPWEDEGYAAEDDWEGAESVESDLEDEPGPGAEDEELALDGEGDE